MTPVATGAGGATGFRPWRRAWHDALYGDRGFYRADAGPRAHFETSANAPGGVVPVLAEALLTLAGRRGCTQIVDVGAGRGELLQALASAPRPGPGRGGDDAGSRVSLLGVDVVPRPDDLAAGIGWLESPGGASLPDGLSDLRRTLVIAHEWLDVVPCDVLEVGPDGELRQVEIGPAGAERLGEPATSEQLAWCARWWPVDLAQRGVRVEVGLTREAAWASLLGRVHDGVVLAVDYGHLLADRPPSGTLAAHRHGHLVPPVPDGSCDLTAHVAWDPLLAATPTTVRSKLTRQRSALQELGIEATRPELGADSAAYLHALQRASAAATLLDPGGLGGLDWLIQPVHAGGATGQADPAPARVEP